MPGGRNLAIVCLLAGLLLGAACLAAQGPLPGDVAATLALQRAFGEAPVWASLLTKTAQSPWLWLTLGAATALAYLRGGGLAAAAPGLTFVATSLADVVLRLVVFAPKPSADLVAVAAPSVASGLPSTFGLVYGGLFGAVLLASGRSGGPAGAAAPLAGLLIAVGAGGRVVLGGHWASQITASILFAVAVASAVHGALQRWRAASEAPV
jgi:hypothetical protein